MGDLVEGLGGEVVGAERLTNGIELFFFLFVGEESERARALV